MGVDTCSRGDGGGGLGRAPSEVCPLCFRKLTPPPSLPLLPCQHSGCLLSKPQRKAGCLFSYLSLTAVPLHLLLLTSQLCSSYPSPNQTPLHGISKPLITNLCGLKKVISRNDEPREESKRAWLHCEPGPQLGLIHSLSMVGRPSPQPGSFLLVPGAGGSGRRGWGDT